MESGILTGLKMHCISSTYRKHDRPRDSRRVESDGHGNAKHAGPNNLDHKFVLTLFRQKASSCANCFVDFILKKFGEKYSHHAEIAKECKKRNDEIYREVMVCMFPDWSI